MRDTLPGAGGLDDSLCPEHNFRQSYQSRASRNGAFERRSGRRQGVEMTWRCLCGCVVVCGALGFPSQGAGQSLGSLAKQEKARRAKQAADEKNGEKDKEKIITADDLAEAREQRASEGDTTTSDTKRRSSSSVGPGLGPQPSVMPEPSTSERKTEKRSGSGAFSAVRRVRDCQKRLDEAKKKLEYGESVLENTKRHERFNSTERRREIVKHNEEVVENLRRAVDEAQDAFDDAETALRRGGYDPGTIRDAEDKLDGR